MLKRIAEWTERAERLSDEIRDRMPEQYRDHPLNSNKIQLPDDRNWELYELFERDPVAYGWIQTLHHATQLACELYGLESQIRSRATRNGVQLDDQVTAEPEDDVNLENLNPVEGGQG